MPLFKQLRCQRIRAVQSPGQFQTAVQFQGVIPSEVEGPRDGTIDEAAGFLHFAIASVGMTGRTDAQCDWGQT